MLLTISTTHQPATDLGFLLHKKPSRIETEELSFGKAHVSYSDAEPSLCTAALLVEIDPVAWYAVVGRTEWAANLSNMSTTALMRQTPF
jgi:hypothetical protein